MNIKVTAFTESKKFYYRCGTHELQQEKMSLWVCQDSEFVGNSGKSLSSSTCLEAQWIIPGRIAQLVTFLTANHGVASSIPAQSHIFVELDHEIYSTAILHSSTESFKKGCCQLQAKVCAQNTG